MQYLLYTPAGTENVSDHFPGLVDTSDAKLSSMEPLTVPGPDGVVGGRIWHFDDVPARLSQLPTLDYRPAEQDWVQIGGTPVWLGINRKHPPLPADLIRNGGQDSEPRFAGNPVLLHDEETRRKTLPADTPVDLSRFWVVPNQAELPCLLDVDVEGNLTYTPEREHRPTYQRMEWAFHQCENLLREMADDPTGEPLATDQELLDFVDLVMGLNYRLTARIMLKLELIKPEHLWVIVRGATNDASINKLLAELKKKGELQTLAGSASSAGETDS